MVLLDSRVWVGWGGARWWEGRPGSDLGPAERCGPSQNPIEAEAIANLGKHTNPLLPLKSTQTLPSNDSMADSLTSDAATRSTDTDALLSRLSASSLGYLADPISPLLLTPSQRRSATPRPPLINIGTHARTWAIDALVTQFLDSLPGRDGDSAGGDAGGGQVLSLGAGTDGRFWRIKEERERDGGRGWGCSKWVEVDFAEGAGAKARAVATKPKLKAGLGGEPKIRQSNRRLLTPPHPVSRV